jgi:hypothetical protein
MTHSATTQPDFNSSRMPNIFLFFVQVYPEALEIASLSECGRTQTKKILSDPELILQAVDCHGPLDLCRCPAADVTKYQFLLQK